MSEQSRMKILARENLVISPAQVDWRKIGQPRWYDCKLGKMSDKKLSTLTGVSLRVIRHRRELFGIQVWRVDMAIAPYEHLLETETNVRIAQLSGVSWWSVKAYRLSRGIDRVRKTKPAKGCDSGQALPPGHPLAPFRPLIGMIDDAAIAKVAGTKKQAVTTVRIELGLDEGAKIKTVSRKRTLRDFVGPLIGYESLFASMSDLAISRHVGVNLSLVEARRRDLNIKPYRKTSKLDPYEHLLGQVPIKLLSKLAGISEARIREIKARRDK